MYPFSSLGELQRSSLFDVAASSPNGGYVSQPKDAPKEFEVKKNGRARTA